MKSRVSDFIDLFPTFHKLTPNQQILLLVYFHAIEENRESVSRAQLESLFRFAELNPPRNLSEKLAYLCGRGNKLRFAAGEYSLQRAVRIEIENEVRTLRGVATPPEIDGIKAFDFPGRAFKDTKIVKLLDEIKKCYAMQCWNACGILIRIVVERALDAVAPSVKAKVGLKDKINFCVGDMTLPFSKSMRDGLKVLHGAKLVGDIVAHHSSIVLDQGDLDPVIPHFRMLLKEVTTI